MALVKQDFLAHLIQIQSDKMAMVQHEIEQLRLDMSSDTKSTAGDKHETSRAMAQLEMEKLGAQMTNYQQQMHTIKQIQSKDGVTEWGEIGSLIKLSDGYFFLGLALGKVKFENTDIFCLSISSPLGQQLVGKKVGDVIQTPAFKTTIEAIS